MKERRIAQNIQGVVERKEHVVKRKEETYCGACEEVILIVWALELHSTE